MKKRVISMLLAAVMTVTMVSGTVMTAAAEEAEGKQLSVQVGPDPETIDPALNSAVDGGNMILHLFEGLLTVDQDGRLHLDRQKHGRHLKMVLHGLSICVKD